MRLAREAAAAASASAVSAAAASREADRKRQALERKLVGNLPCRVTPGHYLHCLVLGLDPSAPGCLLHQAEIQAEAQKASEDRTFLRSLNEQLLANQKELKASTDGAKAELAQRDAAIADLREQVRQARRQCGELAPLCCKKCDLHACTIRWPPPILCAGEGPHDLHRGSTNAGRHGRGGRAGDAAASPCSQHVQGRQGPQGQVGTHTEGRLTIGTLTQTW